MESPASPVDEVKAIVKRVFFSEDKPYERTSLHVDSLGVFLLLTLYQETNDASYLKRMHELVHQSNVAETDLRFAWFCKWNFALWKASFPACPLPLWLTRFAGEPGGARPVL